MTELIILQSLLGEFYHKLGRLQDLVNREIRFPIAPNKIKVAIGMRRVGKTYFLYQEILKMIQEGVSKDRILYINFEDDRLLPLTQQKLGKLIDAFYSLYPENHEKKCYIFLDEIQNVEDWPLVIRRLHDSKDLEIFLTGSSAKLLSKEIATSLRGRSLSIEIWPYSFEEFMRAKNRVVDRRLYDRATEDQLKKIFIEYLSQGGFPEIQFFEPDVRQRTLQDYVDIVTYRDILERHGIKNPLLIREMILSLIHNVGKPFSINKFHNELKSRGFKIGKDALYHYAEYIEDAYLAFFVPLYDQSIRKMQVNPKKTYAIDPGMVRALTMEYETDLGRLFENLIFLELKRRGYDVCYYLTQERYEIDFLIRNAQGGKKLIQVAWEMENKKTLEREMRALESGTGELKVEGELITLDSFLRQGISV